MKQKNDSLGDRMKANYEERAKTYLMRRTPVIIRLDGKAFHTFTRGFDKPFDKLVVNAMEKTMLYLCKNIQGCVFGYTQSDEITLVLIDYEKFDTSAWFNYETQKMCSVSASLGTLEFNRSFIEEFGKIDIENAPKTKVKFIEAYKRSIEEGACFDSRCFNIPKEEVTNCVFWRQLDAIRNSVQALAQSQFTPKALYCTNVPTLKKMLLEQRQIDWDTLPPCLQHGSACIRNSEGNWIIDENMPILRGSARTYLDDLLTSYETSDITAETTK